MKCLPIGLFSFVLYLISTITIIYPITANANLSTCRPSQTENLNVFRDTLDHLVRISKRNDARVRQLFEFARKCRIDLSSEQLNSSPALEKYFIDMIHASELEEQMYKLDMELKLNPEKFNELRPQITRLQNEMRSFSDYYSGRGLEKRYPGVSQSELNTIREDFVASVKLDPEFVSVEKIAELQQAKQAQLDLQKKQNDRCESKKEDRIRQRLGKVGNQRGYSWCVAYQTSDLLSAARAGNGQVTPQNRISAFDIAISSINSYSNGNPSAPLSELPVGGTTLAALTAQRRGLCYESEFPSDGNLTSLLRSSAETLGTVNRAFSRIADGCGLESTSIGRLSRAVMPVLQNASNQDQLLQMQQRLCRRLEKSYYPACRTYRIKTTTSDNFTEVRELIDARLEKGQPAGINIHVGALFGNDEANHKARVAQEERKDPKDRYDYNSGHAVSVVGRRFNEDTGQCEYLIRNSWGEEVCPNKDEKPTQRFPICEKGHSWVSVGALNWSLMGIDVVLRPGESQTGYEECKTP